MHKNYKNFMRRNLIIKFIIVFATMVLSLIIILLIIYFDELIMKICINHKFIQIFIYITSTIGFIFLHYYILVFLRMGMVIYYINGYLKNKEYLQKIIKKDILYFSEMVQKNNLEVVIKEVFFEIAERNYPFYNDLTNFSLVYRSWHFYNLFFRTTAVKTLILQIIFYLKKDLE